MSAVEWSVVIVSYRTPELLQACLRSLGHSDTVEIFVVDNASGDDSVEWVRREFPHVRVLVNAENLGFARANNQALALASGRWLMLLNPDTEVPAGALQAVAAAFARHPRAGCVGVELRNTDGSLQSTGHAFPGILNQALEVFGLSGAASRIGIGTPTMARAPAGGEGRVDWVSGACMTLSREAYAAVGGLDERLHMYGEEMDWSWRARDAGFETVWTNATHVVHHGGRSGEGMRGELFVLLVRSRLEFLRRHRGGWRSVIARELLSLGAALRLAAWAARGAIESTPSARTRDQIARFAAVVRWRLGIAS